MSALSSLRRVSAKFRATAFNLGLFAALQLHAADIPATNQCGLCYASNTDGERILVALESTDVVLDVKPGLVEAEVTQTFTNRTAAALEAIYLYPLPNGSTLTDFELRFKERIIHSSVHEKQAANAIYDAAKAEGKKTALLTQHDSSLFSTAIANFMPGETVHVVIRFLMPLPLTSRSVDIRFPMVTSDKYFPAECAPGAPGNAAPNPTRVTGPGMAENHFYAFDIQIDGIPIQSIQSESHRLKVQTQDDNHARVSLDQEITIPNCDFLLHIETRLLQQTASTTVTQHTDTGDYGLLTVFPPSSQWKAMKQEAPRDVLFLVDHSGSMAGTRMASARLGLKHCLPMLKPNDRFQIAIFDDKYALFRPGWSTADAASLTAAYHYIETIQAAGGTEVQNALSPCLDLFEDNNREQLLIFLTDGDVGNEASLLNLVEHKIGRARLFAFGIGDEPNESLITRMALAGNGQARFIKNDNAVDRELGDFFATLSAPVLSNLRVSLLDAHDQPIDALFFPEKIGDVFLGRPLQAVYRATAAVPSKLRIEGIQEQQPIQVTVPIAPTPLRGDGIEKHFGRLWYEELDQDWRRAATSGQKTALQKQKLDVALLFQLVTELTSRVAVAQQISRNPNTPINSQRVGQAQPVDQVRADETIVLSPFLVEADEDEGYIGSNCGTGSRMRQTSSCCTGTILSKKLLDDFNQFRVEDSLSFEPELNPAIARSGADTGLLDGLPVATVVDPATISRIELNTSGPAWSQISQRQAGLPGKNLAIARWGDEGIAATTLESTFKLGGDSKSAALAIISWQKFAQEQRSAWLNSSSDFGNNRLLTTVQARQLEGYGRMQMVKASLDHRFSDTINLEATIAWHELHREDALQFRRGSATAEYDNLGFFNLDLLTAETRSLEDIIAQIQLGGSTEISSAKNSWAFQGSWHRQKSDWIDAAVAPIRDTGSLNFSCNSSFPDSHLMLRTDLGFAQYRTPGETKEQRSTKKAAIGLTRELGENSNVFAIVSTEEFLPCIPTGLMQIGPGLPESVSQATEHRQGGQAGVNASAWNDRLSAKIALFHETITDQTFRDWAWERDHANSGAVTLPDGLIRMPSSYARAGEWQREGLQGEIDFTPIRSITSRATWYYDWKNAGPYRGGNRQASLLTKYTFLNGALKGLESGFAVSTRNSLVFNDGYRLKGGIRWDLLTSYRFRSHGTKWIKVQLNLMNLSNQSWQLTRFAKDHGRQILLSVSQEF